MWTYVLIPSVMAVLFIGAFIWATRHPKPVEHADDWQAEHGLY